MKPGLEPCTDIGANLLHKQFDSDREEVIARANAAGVTRLLITCTDLSESARGIEFCRGRPEAVWCTAGVHPHDAKDVEAGWLARLADLADNPEVAALGEMGLDFNRNFSPPEQQIEVFRSQLETAAALGKPVFVHDRDSNGQVFELLNNYASELAGVVVHCFTGTGGDLAHYLEAGFYIGITGWLCDKRRGQPLRDLVPDIPMQQLLVETDAPYLRPHNAPAALNATDKRRNEPALLRCVIEKIAELTGHRPAQIARASHENASVLFGLPEHG